jgi:hypothetical protein
MRKTIIATMVALGMTAVAATAQQGQSSQTPSSQPGSQSGQPDQSGNQSGQSREQPGQSGAQDQSARMSFDAVDKDKDGKITREEAASVQSINFASADTNGDASLSRQEFQTAMAGAQPRG